MILQKKFRGNRLVDGSKTDLAVTERKQIWDIKPTPQLSDERRVRKQLQAFNEASFSNIATMSAADMLDYQSPITVIASEIRQEFEDHVFKAVQNMDIKVDKEELVKALEYDRDQYEKGYKCAEEKFGKYGRWNDCNEILPSNEQKVLVQTREGAVFLASYFGWYELAKHSWVSDSGVLLDHRCEIIRWAEIPPIEQEE